LLQSSGDDTVIAGAGQETIAAFGTGHTLILGNASNLVFIADHGSSTIMGHRQHRCGNLR
jgi:hypothetical protein